VVTRKPYASRYEAVNVTGAEIEAAGLSSTISSVMVVPAAMVLKPESVSRVGLEGSLGVVPATNDIVIGMELFLGAKLVP